MARALVYDRYGDPSVLETRSITLDPPKKGEVLVRVRAAALNPKDSFVRKGRFRVLSGNAFPKRIGVDFAGEVIEGDGLTPGTRVFGALEEVTYRRGTIAEEVVVRTRELARMPQLTFEEAAALPLVSLTSLQALRDIAEIAPGDRVLIHGASGGVGTVAIQIAKSLGALVTTTSSAQNRELCRELGAYETLDYATDDLFAKPYRVVFDVFGNLSFGHANLDKDGVFVSTVPSRRIMVDAMRTAIGHPRARLVVVRSRRADLDDVTRMVEEGTLRPVIDRIVPFADAVEAVRHLETKHSRGKIVISI
ncbi:MAG: NAD(P)-dependent alcohol dehydrogenase [Polyangiales bacterium]